MAEFWRGKIWKWGIVAPVTLLALAGALADIVTSTVDYWPLLAPSYFVIAISVWNNLGDSAKARRRAVAQVAEAPIDEPDADEAGDYSTADSDGIVTHVQPVTVLSLAGGLWRLFAQGFWTFGITFFCMVLIWMAIAVATWVRGYWYIYGPVLAGIVDRLDSRCDQVPPG